MKRRPFNFASVTRNNRTRRATVEKLAEGCLDVHELRRAGVFRDNTVIFTAPFRWPHIRRLKVARYLIILELHNLITPQHIRVSWTPCRYGGTRPWLHCPRCQRRAVKLYKGFANYYCRRCAGNPPYASQTKSAAGRRHFALCKLRLQLGGDARPGVDLPDRPPRMHRKTYKRLRNRIEALEWVLAKRLRTKQPDYPNLSYYLPSSFSK